MRIDPYPPSTGEVLTKTLLQLANADDATGKPAPRIYALVDHLFLSDKEGQRQLAISRWPYRNLLDHLGGAKDHQSLILIALPDANEALRLAIKRLCSACDGLPMLSYIVSRTPFSDLAEHLRTHTEARLAPENDEYLLRIGDTRIHDAVFKHLDDAQRETLLAPVIAWLRIERNGCIVETRGLDTPDALARDMPSLTPEQWQALMADTWPDAILAQLQNSAPIAWRTSPPSQQHAEVTQWLIEAADQGHN